MNVQLTEIMRLITNLIRTGVVTEVDRENWLCRVKTGELETNWISWLTLRAGNARTWWRPSEGEQVVLLSLGGNLETAFALPAIYSNQFAPPSTSADACVTEHPDGGWFEYEPATGRWYVRGIKSMVIEAADNITMKTSEFVLEADRTRINSEVVINGGVGGGGGCKAISNNETFFGAGGGAGGTIISIMTPTQNSYPVTIGAGGAGGVSATYGINGGNSLFASLIAPGGAGGGKSGVTNTNGGNGGVPSTGDINIIGGCGGDGQSGNIGVSGEGGTSYWGGGGRAGAGGGVSGKAYGSGGGGAYDAGYSGTSMTGGKGAAGICIIEEFA